MAIPRSGAMVPPAANPVMPDGRYFVVKGRLWRRSNPALDEETRQALVSSLMTARPAVHNAKAGHGNFVTAHASVDAAERALGKRGPVWWEDGVPDYDRRMGANTPYAGWYAELTAEAIHSNVADDPLTPSPRE